MLEALTKRTGAYAERTTLVLEFATSADAVAALHAVCGEARLGEMPEPELMPWRAWINAGRWRHRFAGEGAMPDGMASNSLVDVALSDGSYRSSRPADSIWWQNVTMWRFSVPA